MKNSNDSHDDISLYVNRIVGPVFEKVAQEAKKNLLLGGGGRSRAQGLALYSPHNYRLYFDFSKENFNPDALKNPTSQGLGDVTHKSLNSGHEHQYCGFMGCRVRVKKSQIEIQNMIEHKRTYLIESAEKAETQIIDILKKKDHECIEALRQFIQVFGGSSDFRILKRHSEDKVYGTDSINAIPVKEKFHNKIVKKVYNERNVEYSDPVFAVNHLVNTGVIEVVPSICQSIDTLAFNINPLRTLKSLISSLDDIPRYKDLIIKLNNRERKELSEWLFTLQ